MKLSRLFQIPFLAAPVSLNELLAFATDAKARLASNTQSGAFDGMVAAISAALEGINAAAGQNLTKLGRRKGAKLTKAGFRRALPRKLARVEAGLIAHFKGDGKEVRLVFPKGRTAVVRAPDDMLRGALNGIVTALTPLAPEMGDIGTMVMEVSGELVADWTALYGVSESSTAEKAAAEAGLRQARKLLGVQLHLALLGVTAHFTAAAAAEGKVLTKKEAAQITARYFRQDLLKDRTRRKE